MLPRPCLSPSAAGPRALFDCLSRCHLALFDLVPGDFVPRLLAVQLEVLSGRSAVLSATRVRSTRVASAATDRSAILSATRVRSTRVASAATDRSAVLSATRVRSTRVASAATDRDLTFPTVALGAQPLRCELLLSEIVLRPRTTLRQGPTLAALSAHAVASKHGSPSQGVRLARLDFVSRSKGEPTMARAQRRLHLELLLPCLLFTALRGRRRSDRPETARDGAP